MGYVIKIRSGNPGKIKQSNLVLFFDYLLSDLPPRPPYDADVCNIIWEIAGKKLDWEGRKRRGVGREIIVSDPWKPLVVDGTLSELSTVIMTPPFLTMNGCFVRQGPTGKSMKRGIF